MVQDYARAVIKLVQATTTDRAGITKIVEAAEQAINDVDRDIATLVSQRAAVVGVFTRFVDVYEIVTSEELRTEDDVERLTEPPSGTIRTAETLRKKILEIADQMTIGHEITVDQIRIRLKDNEVTLPWKNPSAVIGTILRQSGQWRRVEEGRYEETTEDEAD